MLLKGYGALKSGNAVVGRAWAKGWQGQQNSKQVKSRIRWSQNLGLMLRTFQSVTHSECRLAWPMDLSFTFKHLWSYIILLQMLLSFV